VAITDAHRPSGDGRVRSEEVAVQFGQNLLRCRLLAEMSQERLGSLAGLHRTEIGMLEKGARLARVDTLMRLAGALLIPPAELLEGIEWLPAEKSQGGSFSITATRALPAAKVTKGGV